MTSEAPNANDNDGVTPDDNLSLLCQMHPMFLMALTLGFNTMVQRGTSLDDKAYFRMMRNKVHAALKLRGDEWAIEFGDDHTT